MGSTVKLDNNLRQAFRQRRELDRIVSAQL